MMSVMRKTQIREFDINVCEITLCAVYILFVVVTVAGS